MKIVAGKITKQQLKAMAAQMFGSFVKAVVDIEKGIMAVDGELHADEEAVLLEKGSDQKNLWGINLYPDKTGGEWIEFDSMINIRPSQNNRSRDVEHLDVREKIKAVVKKLVQ